MLESRSAYGYYGEFGGATGETTPKRICPICGGEFHVADMLQTYDCHGIPYRLVCDHCYGIVMRGRDYDGEFYSEFDENIYEEE